MILKEFLKMRIVWIAIGLVLTLWTINLYLFISSFFMSQEEMANWYQTYMIDNKGKIFGTFIFTFLGLTIWAMIKDFKKDKK